MKGLSELFPVPKRLNSNDDPYVVIKRKPKDCSVPKERKIACALLAIQNIEG